jgi:hypothetical protein
VNEDDVETVELFIGEESQFFSVSAILQKAGFAA